MTGDDINKERLSSYSLTNKFSKSLLKQYIQDLKSYVPHVKSINERFLRCCFSFLRLYRWVLEVLFQQPHSNRDEGLLLHEDDDEE